MWHWNRSLREAVDPWIPVDPSPIPGDIQGQVGWGLKQPDLVVGSSAHDRELELDGL